MIIGIFALILIFLPFALRSFFNDDVYSRIENMQIHFNETDDKNAFVQEKPDKGPKDFGIHHIVLFKENNYTFFPIPTDVLTKIEKEAKKQKKESQRYMIDVGDRKLLYVIQKESNESLLSFAWSDFPAHLTNELFTKLCYMFAFIWLLSIPLSIFLARFISKPLLQIDTHVKKIANREWETPFVMKRKDEIGRIALSIERLRKRLIKQDKRQQTFIQHVSHELKTPVMVIRNYVQGIEDGIFPKGDLTSSLHTIDEEAERLEKKIKDLLLLTKLDYMSDEKTEFHSIDISSILSKVVDKMDYKNEKITFSSPKSVFLNGNKEQLMIAFENLLDNQLRYARQQIDVSLDESNECIYLSIKNDGECISLEQPNHIFEPFYKGKNGQFGLGLAIVKQIIEQHDGEITVKNLPTGVEFLIKFKKSAI